MGALSLYNPTLLDAMSREDPNGQVATVVEFLNATNEVLDDMTFIEGNLKDGHVTTARTGLPGATWTKLYEHVQPSKSTTMQITDRIGTLEAYSEIDQRLVDRYKDKAKFRQTEEVAQIESMNQEICSTLFYGNETTAPSEFTGLSPRYNSLSGAESSQNVLDGGSNDTDNASIWLLCWGPMSIHGIYPEGSSAGISVEDLGLETDKTSEGLMRVYRSHYSWKCGLSVRDWRYGVRIANIEVSDLTKGATAGADLIDLMAQAIELLPSAKLGRPVFYCNRTIKSFLRRQIANKVASSTLTMDQVAGKHVLTFDGIPVKRCDALLNTETRLT